ncbi:arginyltransferase [Pseudoalteromonas phenolica]|uniref:Aspartate/glutamate leucyltransferase n=1 Tax=Pseudoalteromonas phenolica TaxID=161398 RepID=A0A5R9Q1K9_9GAMM|nr:arginyltransferase [Pseudoalteromonas phenolica]TLX46446.1 arginyltransferase [Pseudoalteromonas phenolica]
MTEHFPSKIGLSQQFDCSYLPDKQEQLLVILDSQCYNAARFQDLLELGFRRSGDQIYRPHCPSCNACESMRLPVKDFVLSKSQKRKLKAAKSNFNIKVSDKEQSNYYALYENYINQKHYDGTMFPPNRLQYESFLFCNWLPVTFIELWDQDELIAVAVTDTMPNSLSAIYTFYHPDYDKFSLGVVMILLQIEFAKSSGLDSVYLGYQIDECRKMSYKSQFKPAERFISDVWQLKL